MEINLLDHVGQAPGGSHVDHGQWIVFCDGVHIGYLPKSANAWLQCIVFMDEPTKAELIEAVSEAARQKVGGAALPVDPDFLDDNEDKDGEE
jgi:hypothetical protein